MTCTTPLRMIVCGWDVVVGGGGGSLCRQMASSGRYADTGGRYHQPNDKAKRIDKEYTRKKGAEKGKGRRQELSGLQASSEAESWCSVKSAGPLKQQYPIAISPFWVAALPGP